MSIAHDSGFTHPLGDLYSCIAIIGGLGFELCVFVAGWRHALRSEWPFIIIIIIAIIIIILGIRVFVC